jgi:hypothetical protein
MEVTMPSGWKETEARAVIAALRKSGLSVEKFAAAQSLSAQRVYAWRKRLADKDRSTVSLLPVRVVAQRDREPVAVVLRSGHVVKVSGEFDEAAFARVVALLGGG